MRPPRRLVLLTAAGAIMAAFAGYRFWNARLVSELADRVAILLPEMAAAARSRPSLAGADTDRQALAGAVFGSDLATALNGPPEAILALVARAVDRDFQEGRVVSLEGWTLALTEVRVVAFMALSAA